MAHTEQREFCERTKNELPQFFKNKKVLDIGSLDINGSNNSLFENCDYIGLDVGEGKNVDIISVGHLYDGPDEYFDVIISTEVFEHDMFYEKTVENVIRMLKPGGLFLFTCAAPGRAEHGTRRCGEDSAPLLIKISEEWADYYKNLVKDDFLKIEKFKTVFPDGFFELNSIGSNDLYFYGVKNGTKYIISNIREECKKGDYKDDIFVIDSWPNNESKENDLINLIKRLKVYNIPILLTGHYPIKPEIQKMVDYYLFDKNNPILHNTEFEGYDLDSGRWTNMDTHTITNKYVFHHDYAIWETMRNAFNFCKFLNKKTIHFFEYDNLPDIMQYRQTFLEKINMFDAIIYEYSEMSSRDPGLSPYCSTYIFSINTDVAIKTIDLIKTKEEYFKNRPNGWQLERIFLDSLRKITNNIHLTEYIANDNELNTQAVWDRDGVDRNGGRFQIYLAVDDEKQLYLHLISGFYSLKSTEDYLVEYNYDNKSKFHNLVKDSYHTELLGKYKKGSWVTVYYEGVEVFKEFLGTEYEKFAQLNKFTLTNESKMEVKKQDIVYEPREVIVNFVDGPYIEIKEKGTHTYHVEFINSDTNDIVFGLDLKSRHWAKCSLKYYINWIIKVRGLDCDFYYEHVFNTVGKKFLISFDSKSLGDTLAWIPYVEKFQRDNKCTVVCSTFFNYLFKEQYPNISFISPGSTVTDLYGCYRLGLYYDNKKQINYTKNPIDPTKGPLLKIGSDILGFEYEELKPKLPSFNIEKKKRVCIGIHSTAQCKYWNNPNGWQEVVNYLRDEGYEVILLSEEEDGYMGNPNPKRVIKHEKGSLKQLIKTLESSELFIGISGGLSWVAWGTGIPTVLISGFTDEITEPVIGINRVINKNVCNGCWNTHTFDPGDWKWCPLHKGTDRQFECSKTITSEMVINEIKTILFEKV
jgi:autotransporter strand-loop-strand O-heptosyltransferase